MLEDLVRPNVKSIAKHLTWRKLILLAAGSLILAHAGDAAAAEHSFVCLNPDKKAGGIGVYRGACDADQFGDIERVKMIYPKFIFDRRLDYPGQTAEYVTRISSLIKQIARKYIVSRNPEAGPAEIAAFQLAALSIAMQESFMTHYRYSDDNHLKLMTGDRLLSHGIMQVNQTYHATRLDGIDSSLDLVGNIKTALDVYYTDGWRRAPERDCYAAVNGSGPSVAKRLETRTRMSYSAYNGGPGAICRITNKKHNWSGNDVHFKEQLDEKPWVKYVTDENAPTGLNIDALMAGDDYGAIAKDMKGKYLMSRSVILANGKTCVTADGKSFQCAEDMRVFSCLSKIDPDVLDADPVRLAALPEGSTSTTVRDREALCASVVKELYKVGEKIVLKKEIVMRREVGGAPVGAARAGRVFQVIDYDIRLGGKTERYYKIKTSAGAEGWVFGGNDDDATDWITLASTSDEETAAAARATARAPRATATPAAEVAESTAAASETEAEQRERRVSLNTVTVPTETLNAAAGEDEDTDYVLPTVGSIIEIAKDSGVRMRAEPGEEFEQVGTIAAGVRLKVEKVVNKGAENQIYILVKAGDKEGYIYAGRTYPTVTLQNWIKIIK